MPIPAGTHIGHVHLKVADIDRAIGFYSGVLGLPRAFQTEDGAVMYKVSDEQYLEIAERIRRHLQ